MITCTRPYVVFVTGVIASYIRNHLKLRRTATVNIFIDGGSIITRKVTLATIFLIVAEDSVGAVLASVLILVLSVKSPMPFCRFASNVI